MNNNNNNKGILLLLTVVLSILEWTHSGVCPVQQALSVCACNQTTITCGGTQAINLKQIFANISVSIANKTDKSFDNFILNNNAITEIEDNTFHDIAFKSITLSNAKSLRRIAANAFSALNCETIESFEQSGDSQLGSDQYITELFVALSSLINVRTIFLDKSLLASIPSHAFTAVNGFQYRLNHINFNRHYSQHIKSIGSYAFYYLNNLTELHIFANEIDHISANAFDFWSKSDNLLNISLRENLLNDTSIEIGAFSNAQRPLFIDLKDNKLTYLNESVFSPILKADKRNTIDVDFMYLSCDCRMAWIIREKVLKDQIKSINCKNGKEFWTLTENDLLANC